MLGLLVGSNPRYYPKFESTVADFLGAVRDVNAGDEEVRVAVGVALSGVCKEVRVVPVRSHVVVLS